MHSNLAQMYGQIRFSQAFPTHHVHLSLTLKQYSVQVNQIDKDKEMEDISR